MATPELALVRRATALVESTAEQFTPLMRPGSRLPIPFFGLLPAARIVTFGLNPSANEFTKNRGWELPLSSEQLCTRLLDYFAGGKEHRWFRAWSIVLEDLASSYQRDAAHIDLSPRPTAGGGKFRTDPSRALFLRMLRTDAPLWIEALEVARHAKLILMAGSATNLFYLNEFVQSELSELGVALTPLWKRGKGPGQTAFQTLVLPSGRQIPTFFCSTGPTKPDTLIDATRRNLPGLRAALD